MCKQYQTRVFWCSETSKYLEESLSYWRPGKVISKILLYTITRQYTTVEVVMNMNTDQKSRRETC